MRKILSLVALIAMTGTTLASDLPSFKSPVFMSVPDSKTGFYSGIDGGTLVNKSAVDLGGQIGYDFGVLRTEVDFDRLGLKKGANIATADFIGQVHVGNLVPYALAGAGYAWTANGQTPVWNVGGGVRFDVTDRIALDTRYRFIDATKANYSGFGNHSSVVTAGIQYRF